MAYLSVYNLLSAAAYTVDMSLVPDYFYPFGPSAGDTRDSTADDSYSGPHNLAQSITFYGDTYSSLYVSVNCRFVSPFCSFSNTLCQSLWVKEISLQTDQLLNCINNLPLLVLPSRSMQCTAT